MHVSGVCSAGLRITVQPAAVTGAILDIAMLNGKFHLTTVNVISHVTNTTQIISNEKQHPNKLQFDSLHR